MPRTKHEGERSRLHLDVPTSVVETIRELQRDFEADSMTEVVRRCVHLVHRLFSFVQQGYRLTATKNGETHEILIPEMYLWTRKPHPTSPSTASPDPTAIP